MTQKYLTLGAGLNNDESVEQTRATLTRNELLAVVATLSIAIQTTTPSPKTYTAVYILLTTAKPREDMLTTAHEHIWSPVNLSRNNRNKCSARQLLRLTDI